MGGAEEDMPVTFATMLIGTLAIAGIPPFAGFFSKDEILFRAFLANKIIWVLAVATALMTAFYMFRLMAMTFFGNVSRSGVGDTQPRGRGHRRDPRRAASCRSPRARPGAQEGPRGQSRAGRTARLAGGRPSCAGARRRCAWRPRSRPLAWTARIAEADDDAAPDPGRRRDCGGLRRYSRGAWRRQRHRAFPRAEFHRVIARRSWSSGGAWRGGDRARGRRGPRVDRRRARPDGLLRAHRRARHRPRAPLLRRPAGDLGRAGVAVFRRCIACC